MLPDPLYDRLIEYINNPIHIRKGPNENVRTTELAIAFSNHIGMNISYKSKLPQLMIRMMNEHPELSIIKKVRNYGTIYTGIGLSTDPLPKIINPPLTAKENNDRRALRNKQLMEKIKNDMCQQNQWTVTQYQQMVNLRLIYVIRHEGIVDISGMSIIAHGRLVQYISESNVKLEQIARYAKAVRTDFERCIEMDRVLSDNMSSPVYTNRLLAAERTYDAGNKLEVAVNSYMNTVQNLPQTQYARYLDIQSLYNLAQWLKNNSMYKTRLEMRIVQETFERDNVDEEEVLHEYGDIYSLTTSL